MSTLLVHFWGLPDTQRPLAEDINKCLPYFSVLHLVVAHSWSFLFIPMFGKSTTLHFWPHGDPFPGEEAPKIQVLITWCLTSTSPWWEQSFLQDDLKREKKKKGSAAGWGWGFFWKGGSGACLWRQSSEALGLSLEATYELKAAASSAICQPKDKEVSSGVLLETSRAVLQLGHWTLTWQRLGSALVSGLWREQGARTSISENLVRTFLLFKLVLWETTIWWPSLPPPPPPFTAILGYNI